MRFPGYVPELVQKLFLHEIEDLTEAIENIEKRSPFLWLNFPIPGVSPYNEPTIPREKIVTWLEFIKRIAGLDADDDRIVELHNILRKELMNDAQWLRYFASACRAMQDYSEYRKKKREAARLLPVFKEQCDALLETLRRLQKTGIALPIEMWDRSDKSDEPLLLGKLIVAGWPRLGLEPLLSKLSDEVDAMLRTTITVGDFEEINAAISRQKPNPKTEYLRAFGFLMTSKTGIIYAYVLDRDEASLDRPIDEGWEKPIDQAVTLTPGVRRAMAITATVAFNNDIEVSEDDVRKALGGSEHKSARSTRNHPKRRNI